MRLATVAVILLAASFMLTPGLPAADDAKPKPPTTAESWIASMQWRPIGPANMGGRITALAVCESDPSLWWAATASGGLLKTTNNGVTFEHQFDREKTVSIGDVAVAPSDPSVVWIGTGEANPRNSVSWGDGVYKSTDGGETWTNMGLRKSFQIGAVVIHPENPDVVYVGALGRLWGENEERGLYKTTDGGKTWSKILHVDNRTGVVDIAMHPTDPDTLLVATYERQRDGFDSNDPAKKFGPGSALHKTTDGGQTFRKITKGLPTGKLGRIGLAHARTEPEVVYAVVESEKTGAEPENAPYMGITGKDADVGARLTRVIDEGPCAKAGLRTDDIVVALGDRKVHSYEELVRFVRYHVAGEAVAFEIVRDRKTLTIDVTLGKRPKRRGGPARTMFAASLGGQRANLQDQQGEHGHEYGGVYRSTDGGESFTRVNSLDPRPMYFSEIRVAPDDENRVYVLGIRCWQSADGGVKFTPDAARGPHVDHHAMWIDPKNSRHIILGNDGGIYVTYDRGKKWDHLNHVAIGQFYHVAVGPRLAYRVYGGLQDNGSWGGPSRVRHGSGPSNTDWFRLGGGDGFVSRVDAEDPDQVYFAMQYGGIGRSHLRTGERGSLRPRGPRGTRYRFNWNTPFVLSHHNSRIFYSAGNKVFRSLDRGNRLRAISPDITAGKRGTATSLAESPLDPDVLWVGTDDGALWSTRDGGHTWHDAFAPSAAVKPPEPAPEPSAPSPRGARLLSRMLRMDRNGDAALQREEVPARLWGMLRTLDENRDDVIDHDELTRRAAEVARRADSRSRSGNGEPPPAAKAPAKPKPPPAGAARPLSELRPERRWVSWIEPSRYQAERVYLVLDGHRSDDDRPHLLVSENHGATWRSVVGDLPADAGTTRVLHEDLVDENLLYLGTELGAWVTLDRGAHWIGLNTNLPTVAVHAFAQHPTAGELVVATHGRSLWILDVSVLRQMRAKTLEADSHLFVPGPVVQWRPQNPRGRARGYVGRNPTSGAVLHYALAKKTEGVKLAITTLDGKLVRDLEAPAEAGLHRVVWDLRWNRQPRSRSRTGPRARPGAYRVVLTAGEMTRTRDVALVIDPDHQDDRWIAGADLKDELDAEDRENKLKRRSPWLERGED